MTGARAEDDAERERTGRVDGERPPRQVAAVTAHHGAVDRPASDGADGAAEEDEQQRHGRLPMTARPAASPATLAASPTTSVSRR